MAALVAGRPDPALIKKAGANATAIFVAGWALGGLIFGAVGDRIGRAKTLTFTVLMYSLFTGLSARSRLACRCSRACDFSPAWVWGASSDFRWRWWRTRCRIGRGRTRWVCSRRSAVGNVTAGLIAVCIGWLETFKIVPVVRGAACFSSVRCRRFFVRVHPVAPQGAGEMVEGAGSGASSPASGFGSTRLLGRPALARAGVGRHVALRVGGGRAVGHGFFQPRIDRRRDRARVEGRRHPAGKTPAIAPCGRASNMVIQNIGAFAGMMVFTKLAQPDYGRKRVFAVGFVCGVRQHVPRFQVPQPAVGHFVFDSR